MRWLAREAHREPEGSIGFGAQGRGRVLDHPVSVRAFGAPSALDERAYVELTGLRGAKCAQKCSHCAQRSKRETKKPAGGDDHLSSHDERDSRFGRTKAS